jgi:hypothetical protein
MPCDYKRYPKNWRELVAARLALAGHRCECAGECKSLHLGGRCGAPNGALVQRRKDALSLWVLAFCESETPTHHRPVKVILTTAHLDRDPSGDDLSRLRSFCQLCHLRYDSQQHGANAAKTRRSKRQQKQLALPGGAR